ncbi:MAG: phosphoribosylformylglycinamidine cyclo-ligase [Firmicutes bacterium]|nr:phosphoribosylformylglycinamidine cyclo-ligase [Bacillota bacterium]
MKNSKKENLAKTPISYKDAGVDVEAGYKAVDLIKKKVRATFDENVLGDIGAFGGLYSIAGFNMKNPVLVSGTDGVGTKLRLAFLQNKHDTVGIDLVAMSVNDVVCQGARPLFFLDYFACGKLLPESMAEVVGGIADGCRESGCALLGGETAEMPGFYENGEYDLAGFCVGIADRDKLITGKNIVAGDVLIGLRSSGVHSNGFSLVRKVVTEEELKGELGRELLTPTKIYVKSVLALNDEFDIKGVSHITGGGFIENIPRILPNEDLCVKIDLTNYEVPKLFKLLAERTNLDTRGLYNTFNMGTGMVLCVDKKDADKLIKRANELGEEAYYLGEIKKKEDTCLGECRIGFKE